MAKPDYFLYGSELSLYTGKARCYLRKKGVHFETRSTLHPRFAAAVRAIGHSYQPILETASGEFVQDTTRIIDFVEARHPEPSAYPSGPCQRLVALLMELYGDEGLLKPAMHYRWNFPAENDAFLSEEFARAISPIEIPIPNGGGVFVWRKDGTIILLFAKVRLPFYGKGARTVRGAAAPRRA